MRVIVVGNRPHDVVDVDLVDEMPADDVDQTVVESSPRVVIGPMVVRLPHDHRHETGFAFCDPTFIVLVEPFGESGRLTQFAIGHVRQCRRLRSPSERQSAEGSTSGGRITASITWITPFDASTSAVTTLAPFTVTPPSVDRATV